MLTWQGDGKKMTSELSFVIEISSRDKNFQWDDLKRSWQTEFGGKIWLFRNCRGGTRYSVQASLNL